MQSNVKMEQQDLIAGSIANCEHISQYSASIATTLAQLLRHDCSSSTNLKSLQALRSTLGQLNTALTQIFAVDLPTLQLNHTTHRHRASQNDNRSSFESTDSLQAVAGESPSHYTTCDSLNDQRQEGRCTERCNSLKQGSPRSKYPLRIICTVIDYHRIQRQTHKIYNKTVIWRSVIACYATQQRGVTVTRQCHVTKDDCTSTLLGQ
jgi:hypothetical protein